jgi:hypothetical protein
MDPQPIYPMQSAFARGEVSPALYGRVDLTGWSQGLRTLRNAMVRPEGCVQNRPGFGYLGNSLLAASKSTILVPFSFSASQSYVFEIGNLSCQVFSGAAIVNGPASVNFSTAVFVFHGFFPHFTYTIQIATTTPHGLSVGQNISIQGVVGTGSFATLNGPQQVLSIDDATHFQVAAQFSNTGVYTSGGVIPVPLTFATPWAQADLPLLRWSQSTDTLTVVHPKYPPYEIKRTSATSFTCLPAIYVNGPFLTQNTDGVTFVYASAKSGTVTLNASAAIFNPNHVGALFQLTQQDLSNITPWEPNKEFYGSPIGTYRRASLKNYQCTSVVNTSPGTSQATGSWIPSHSQGTQPDGDGNVINSLATNVGVNWTYQDSGSGVVLITAYISPTQVTGVVQPNYTGGPGLLPTSVVGGPTPVFGPFTFSGNGVNKSFTPLTGSNSADPTKYFVTVNGAYVAPSMYSVTATGPLVFLNAPPTGVNNVVISQVAGLGQTSYWAFGAFSADQGYPSAVSYFPDRLVLAATPQQPVGVFGSKTSQYHDFGVSNPVVASDAFTVFLNARQLNAINDLIPLSDLLVGTSNITWRLWPGSTGTALGPLAIAATPQSYYGQNANCASILFGDSAIFPEYDGRRLRDLIYQFAYDKFMGQELTLYSRHLIPFGTSFQRLGYKPDPIGQLVLGLRSDGILLACTYLREQQIVGWARWDTQGTFEDLCVVPEFGSYGVYAITNRVINGVQVRYIEHLENREVLTLYDWQFLDCNITYDGRNTSATTMGLTGGTTWLSGDTGTVGASSSAGWATFLPTDVGNEIWLYDAAGNRCRTSITAYVSPLVATVRLKDPCPVTLQGSPTSAFTFARAMFTGATQLAGMPVVAYADGNVLGMHATGTAADGTLTVTATGTITLPNPCGVVQIGLPYLSDFETLPLNEQGQATIRMRSKTEPVIYLDVSETRNFLAGTDFTTMMPNIERAFETYTVPISQQNGILWTRVVSALDSECHTCIRQNMPLPITIRMHIPQVTVGEPVS